MATSDCMAEHSIELKRAKKKMSCLEFELNKVKLVLGKINQVKANLDAIKQARYASYTASTQV